MAHVSVAERSTAKEGETRGGGMCEVRSGAPASTVKWGMTHVSGAERNTVKRREAQRDECVIH